MSDLAQIGVVRSSGFSSWLIRVITRSNFNHVVLMVDEGVVVSAEVSGVQLMPAEYFADAQWSQFDLSEREQRRVIEFAKAQLGKPYGVLTYLWIGVERLTRWGTPRWLERRLNNQKTWVCSALVDAAYQHAGIHFFRDHRSTGAVVPGDIAKVMFDFGWVDAP